MKNIISNKPHGNIFRKIYLYIFFKVKIVKLERENKHLRRELERLMTLLPKNEEEY